MPYLERGGEGDGRFVEPDEGLLSVDLQPRRKRVKRGQQCRWFNFNFTCALSWSAETSAGQSFCPTRRQTSAWCDLRPGNIGQQVNNDTPNYEQ